MHTEFKYCLNKKYSLSLVFPFSFELFKIQANNTNPVKTIDTNVNMRECKQLMRQEQNTLCILTIYTQYSLKSFYFVTVALLWYC